MDSELITSRKTLLQARDLAERVSPSPGRSPRPSDGRGVRGEGNVERGENSPKKFALWTPEPVKNIQRPTSNIEHPMHGVSCHHWCESKRMTSFPYSSVRFSGPELARTR